jgi:very-short-patch-repair endonuclease
MPASETDVALEHARQLRRNMTSQERKLWYLFLQHYPVKFYKQRVIGTYIVDFYCAAANLAVELDGSQHYDEAEMEYDSRRSAFLEKHGLQFIRFSNHDINTQFESVCESIDFAVHSRLP